MEFDLSTSYFIEKFRINSTPHVRWSYHNSAIDIDIAYRYSLIEKKKYFSFKELSLSLPLSSYTKLSLGVKNQNWSEADRYWNLGLWQPRYIVDPFRPSQMGLPGIYVDWEGAVFFTLFLSYITLPDIIIYPDLVNGRILSSNPFFVSPVVTSAGATAPSWKIKELQKFDWSLFLKPMFGFQVKHKLPHSELSVAYAYKTINQLQYSVLLEKISLSELTEDTKGNVAISDLRYDMGYHHLSTIEIKVNPVDSMSFFASAFYEKPVRKALEKGWTHDSFESHLTTSLHTRIQKETPLDRTSFTLGYLKVFESKLRSDKSNLITEEIEFLFGRGFEWASAVSFSLEYYAKRLFNGYNLNLRLNYALDNKYYFVGFENNFQLTSGFSSYISGDMLFRLAGSDNNRSFSSIGKYKDLSRILLGVKYVF